MEAAVEEVGASEVAELSADESAAVLEGVRSGTRLDTSAPTA